MLMKRIVILMFLSLISCVIVAQQQINLTECYDKAQQNYPDIERYDLIEKSSKYNVNNALKSWLPQISVNAKASYQSDVTTFPFDDLTALYPSLTFPELSKDQYMIQAEVVQTIWDGNRTRSQRKIIESESAIERQSLEVQLYAIKERVNGLYFGILLQEEIIKQNSILNEELKSNIERVNVLIDNGIANVSDRQMLEVEMLQLKQRTIDLEASLSTYKKMLSFLIGEEIGADTELIVPSEVYEIDGEINRPELQLFDIQNSLLDAKTSQLKSNLMPQFALYINGGYGSPALDLFSDDFDPFYIAGVRFSWNIGGIYRNKNNMRNIEIQRQSVEVEKEKFIFNSRLAMINQQSDIQKIRALMESDSDIVELRRDIKLASQVKFDNGTQSMTDLVSDINALNEAEQRLSTRKIELLSLIYTYLYTTNQ